ncbi:hypothetical protein C6502_04250 [Candidatus Poribacteria bacterium]|nr:MAG: hypothetical protein C6502_04250 [Candidatus Poribacteria bacterium]
MANERNMSLTEEEIRELIANEFPRLITQNTEIRYELIGVMSETFAKKEDITAILNELRQMREESERQRVEFREEMQVLREESNQLREESEQRWVEFREEMQVLREESNQLREESEQRWVEFREEMQVLREESNQLREESEQRRVEFRQEMEAQREESNQLREESRASRAYLDDELKRFHHTVQGLGARWGLQSEEAFRNGLAAILTDELGFRVERYEGYDDSGSVFGQPEQVEMDVIIRNSSVIAIEIKSSVSRSDLSLFQRKVAFFEQTENVTVNRKFFISPFVDPNAVGLAARMGIELYTHSLDIII